MIEKKSVNGSRKVKRITFFKKLFSKCGGKIEFLRLKGKKANKQFLPLEDGWEEILQDLNKYCKKYKDHDLYFGVATKDGIRSEKSQGGAKENVVNIPCFWADLDFKDIDKNDFDKARKEYNKRLEEFSLKPSYIIESGGGFHLYWLLDKPAEKSDSTNIERINKWLVTELGADKVATEVSHKLRLPKTTNYKYPEKPKCKIIESNSNGYTLEEVLKLIPDKKAKPNPKKAKTIGVEDIEKRVRDIVKKAVEEKMVLGEDTVIGRAALAFSLKDGLGEGGRPYIHDLLGFRPTYDKETTDKRYSEILTQEKEEFIDEDGKSNKCKIASFFHWAREAGITDGSAYFISEKDGCLYRKKIQRNNAGEYSEYIKLSNFDAWITKDINRDDGVETTRVYMIKGKLKDAPLPQIEVKAKIFPSLTWLDQWGSRALISPGNTLKDHVRYYIQDNRSAEVEHFMQYSHTGWIKTEEKGWIYLTKKGAIGDPNISVNLSEENKRYNIPLIVNKKTEKKAIQESLKFLKIGPKNITYALLGLVYLSPLTMLLKNPPNFIVTLYGKTGSYKTAMALELQRHFGNSFSIPTNLANFSSTANALEKKASDLQDALMVIDDYHPAASRGEAIRMEIILERFTRGVANRGGRHRLKSDATERATHIPKCMALVTGEQILTNVTSTMARTMVLEITSKDDINTGILSELQNSKLRPMAMSSFLHWLRPRIGAIQGRFENSFSMKREEFRIADCHGTTAGQAAYLSFALELMCEWAIEKGALTGNESRTMLEESRACFKEHIVNETARIESEDPASKYIELIKVLLQQEKVHILNKKKDSYGVIGGKMDKWDKFQSTLIGYYGKEYFYLMPEATYKEVTGFLSPQHFPVSKGGVNKLLRLKGVLIPRSGGRNTYSLSGVEGNPTVMKVKRSSFFEKKETKSEK